MCPCMKTNSEGEGRLLRATLTHALQVCPLSTLWQPVWHYDQWWWSTNSFLWTRSPWTSSWWRNTGTETETTSLWLCRTNLSSQTRRLPSWVTFSSGYHLTCTILHPYILGHFHSGPSGQWFPISAAVVTDGKFVFLMNMNRPESVWLMSVKGEITMVNMTAE